MYKRGTRLWFRALWWYIYLAWRNDELTTREVLKANNSDTIVQLVERTGKYGYRKEVYNEILFQRCAFGINSEEFKKLMMLNTMKVNVIDPYLINGGVERYVNDLYREVIMGE